MSAPNRNHTPQSPSACLFPASVLQSGDLKWHFTLKGESFNVSSLKSPDTGPVDVEGDIAGAVLEKAFLYEKVMALIDAMFNPSFSRDLHP